MAQKKRTRLAPEARRRQLLDTAARIILEQGLSGFTMEALANEAGVSTPLVYRYFSSRRVLFQELLELEFDQYRHDLQEQLDDAQSFEDIVRIFVTKNFDEVDRGSVTQILRSQPDIREAIRRREKREERGFAQFLVRLLADSFALTRAQAAQIAIMGSGASVAAAEHVSRSGRDRDALIDETVSFIIGGMTSFASAVASD